MIKLLSVSMLLLIILGCDQSEKAETAQKSKETVTEKVDEASKNAAVYVKDAAETAAEKAGEVEKQAESAVKETVEETKQSVSGAVDVVAEKSKSAAVATTTAVGEGVKAAKQAINPETIVLEASYGDVTFPHALHQVAYACSDCHGEGTPGLFGLNKEKAHVLCKDCHKKEGSGPTACKGCHKK